jgi:hypothetical protein
MNAVKLGGSKQSGRQAGPHSERGPEPIIRG